MRVLQYICAIVLVIAAMFLIVMGAKLAILGGSFYYIIVGLCYALSAWWMIKKDIKSLYLITIVLFSTIVWTWWEVGFDYWAWFPRFLTPLGFFIVACFIFSSFKNKKGISSTIATVLGIIVFGCFFARGFMNKPIVAANVDSHDFKVITTDNKPINWTGYSRDTMGIRYSPFTQINRDNVNKLKLAWIYHTGRDQNSPNKVDQNTPLQIDNTLYACTPENTIHAINATTGERKWVFESKASAISWQRCRGLGYYKDVSTIKGAECHERIIANTVDGRLFALDSETGKPCSDFGDNGVVNLRDNMGDNGPGYYYQTSAPLVAKDKIVIGGWVADNQQLGEPAGAIRAFDVKSGQLLWAWDPADPNVKRDPISGNHYTLGTPNMWTHAAYDPDLDLIYAPMGSAGTDYYNADRPKKSIPYNAALVALDGQTGQPKWVFQTTHDDLWDYDLPSQPALIDMKNEAGEVVPTIIQLTKRGQIFALDRRNGTPVTKVEERPVPQTGSIPENTISPTQPYSVGMPQIGAEPLSEEKTWGTTMFDQLLCRISFQDMRYDGDFTLVGVDKWGLMYPGALGGFNWGSASYDPENHLLFVNDIRIPNVKRLITREQYKEVIKTQTPTPDGHGLAPMDGTPYGIETNVWFSPIGVPCLQPPFGTVTAINLDTKKIAWQIPAGTAEELGPFGIKAGMPLTMGMPTYAGTTVTAGGIVFFAGTQDNYLRGYDAQTGHELIKLPLPVGASATPMVFISPENGKEYVVISVGGAAHSKNTGDYIMAFTLPDE